MPLHVKSALPPAPSERAGVAAAVAEVIARVRSGGAGAVRELSARFDAWEPDDFRLSAAEIDRHVSSLPDQVVADVVAVQERVRAFALVQRASMTDVEVETEPGVFLGHRHVAVDAVGAYVPGGRYPLTASAHMTVVTAKAAGVARVAACTPPIRGVVPSATIAAMHLAGADEVYALGGIQAVASMAIGNEVVAKVDMIAGPGNPFVAEAKRQLFGEVGIDLVAGPTEVLVVADDSADAFTVAVDLLSQAEHGPDSPAVLLTTSQALAREVVALVDAILVDMPTADVAGVAWRDHGEVVVHDDADAMWAAADALASEHVQVFTRRPREALERMRSYGALFLGEGTCVSYGDKVIGTNHVLPTRGAARYSGGLWVGKYLKTLTHQEVRDDAASASLGRLCGRAARVELFEGHARSGDLRAHLRGGDEVAWIDALAPARRAAAAAGGQGSSVRSAGAPRAAGDAVRSVGG